MGLLARFRKRVSDPTPELMETREEAHGRLSSDEPILSAGEDQLEREPMAEALTATIERVPSGAGFVIALTGAWGDGKTSVVNMTTALVRERGLADVVEFNPWLFSGAEQLVSSFFSELGNQLGESDRGRLGEVAERLRKYGGAIGALRVLPYVGAAIGTGADLARGAGDLLGQEAESLHHRRNELRAALIRLERPVVVTVDDLDRLEPREVADVMRLVRLVGDFPNLIYLLAFERRRVEDALGDGDQAIGRAYLEKIVQVSYGLPPVRPELFDQVLSQAISDAVGDLEPLTFDRTLYTNYYAGGLRSLFRNLRDIRRYCNSVPATIDLIGDEVELSDVLALEAIRVFEPAVFDRVVALQAELTQSRDLGFGMTKDQAVAEAVRSIPVDASNPTAVTDLIKRLFPAAERYFGGSHYGSDWQGRWRRDRRVANPEVLGIYMNRVLPPGVLATRAVAAVVGVLGDGESLALILDQLSGPELERLLGRLEDYEGEFGEFDLAVPVETLLNRTDRVRRERKGAFDVGGEYAVSRLLLRLLRTHTSDEVEETVAKVRPANLSAQMDLAVLVGYRPDAGHQLVSREFDERLMRDLARNVMAASADDLAREPQLARLLRVAHEVVGSDRVKDRLREHVRNKRFLIAWLRSSSSPSYSNRVGDAAVERRLILWWDTLVEMLGQDDLALAVSKLDDADVPTDEEGRSIVERARLYAGDPARAAADLATYRQGPPLPS